VYVYSIFDHRCGGRAERFGASEASLTRAERCRGSAKTDLAKATKALRKAAIEVTKYVNAPGAARHEYAAISASAIEARDELRRRLVEPHPSRWSSFPSGVVSVEGD
jgi:hypothetical protein